MEKEKVQHETTEQAWLTLLSLLKETKVSVSSHWKKGVTLRIIVHSTESVMQFQEIFESLEPGLTLKVNVPYINRIKKEFKRRADNLQQSRTQMIFEVDEMDQEHCDRAGI
jgi:hypothetical protein